MKPLSSTIKLALSALTLLISLLLICYLNADALTKFLINNSLSQYPVKVSSLKLDNLSANNISFSEINLNTSESTAGLENLSINFQLEGFSPKLNSVELGTLNVHLAADKQAMKKGKTKKEQLILLESYLPQIWLPAINLKRFHVEQANIIAPDYLQKTLQLSNLLLERKQEQIFFTLNPLPINTSFTSKQSGSTGLKIELQASDKGQIQARLYGMTASSRLNISTLNLQASQQENDLIGLEYDLKIDLEPTYLLLGEVFDYSKFKYSAKVKSTKGTMNLSGKLMLNSEFDNQQAIQNLLASAASKVDLDAGLEFDESPFSDAKIKLLTDLDLKNIFDTEKRELSLQVLEPSYLSMSPNSNSTVYQSKKQFRYLSNYPITLKPVGNLQINLSRKHLRSNNGLQLKWAEQDQAAYVDIKLDNLQGYLDDTNHFSGQSKQQIAAKWDKNLYGIIDIDNDFKISTKQQNFSLLARERNSDIELESKIIVKDRNFVADYVLDIPDFSHNSKHLSRLANYWLNGIDLKAGAAKIIGTATIDLDSFAPWPVIKHEISVSVVDAKLNYDIYPMSGINFTSELAGRNFQLSTVSKSSFSIEKIISGTEVTDITYNADAKFNFKQQSTITINNLNAHLLKGEISSKAFTLQLQHPKTEDETLQYSSKLLLDLEDIELAELMSLVDNPDISGHGLLYGQLPVYINEKISAIDTGLVNNLDKNGVIRYRPKKEEKAAMAKQVQVEVMLDVLGNLNYNTLEAKIELNQNGMLLINGHVAGTNPDLKGNQPIVFNPNIELDFYKTLFSLQIGQAVSDSITKKIQQRIEAAEFQTPN